MANIYKINADAMRVPVVAADPVSIENGLIWYNTVTNKLMAYQNGTTAPIGSDTVFLASAFRIEDNSDHTKLIAFNASAITTGTTRTIAMPDADVSLGLIATAIQRNGSVAFTAAQSMGSFKLTNVADPTSAQDAATKAYVDAVALGLKPKKATYVASTGNLTLSGEQTIDGLLTSASRVLVKDQTAPEENGIYVTAAGAWARATDFDSVTPIDEINGAWVPVQSGTINAGRIYVQYGNVSTIGTDPITFEFYNPLAALVGGDMITVSGSTISVDLATVSGLESSNPGVAAGQLRIKLEASNPSLKITGSNELGAKLDAAGAITSGSGGLIVGVDGSTIEINTNALRVKDAGITDAKIATGIDAAKLADGSVSNTEFQYLGNVTSDIQTQFGTKVTGPASAVDNTVARYDSTTGKLIQGSGVVIDDSNNLSGFGVLVHGANGQQSGPSTTDFFETQYIHATTLTASSSSTVATPFTFASASFQGVILEYKIQEATTNRVRTGQLYISTNGADTSITDTFTETGDISTAWDLNVNGANIELRYTTGANNKVMRAVVKRIKA